MSVPPQPPINRLPYSRTLSALRKTELVQLSVDFKLPTDGNVLTLRNRIRVYMNYHRDVLINNPRYKALFPKAREPNIPMRRSNLSSQTVRTPSSAGLSYHRTPSPTPSFESWNGIEDDQIPVPLIPPHPILQHPPPHHQEPVIFQHPPPSPSVSDDSVDSPPPVVHPAGSRKFVSFTSTLLFIIFSLRHYAVVFPFPFLDTMKSFPLSFSDTMKSFVFFSLPTTVTLCSPILIRHYAALLQSSLASILDTMQSIFLF